MASSSASKDKPHASAEDSSAFGPIAERFRRAGELERAINLCREGLQRFPSHISARVTLGWALLELGKYDEARVELEQVLRRRPDNLAAIRALAELHDRSEQTMNLPMDGPGQWPPSPDAVDEAAGEVVAQSFLALNADVAEPVESEEAIVSSYVPQQPAVAAPPELGLAMWSALPGSDPAGQSDLSLSNMVAAVEPQLVAAPVVEASEPDIAALLAEAESLDALAEGESVEAIAGDSSQEFGDAEPTLTLDVGSALTPFEELEFETPTELFATHVPGPEVLAPVVLDEAPVVLDEAPVLFAEAPVPLDAATAVPDEPAAPEVAQVAVEEAPAVHLDEAPGFQLDAQSIGELEAAVSNVDLEAESAPIDSIDPDAQPILRFDLEPVVEVAPVVHVAPVADVVLAPEPSSVALLAPPAETAEVETPLLTAAAIAVEPEFETLVALVPSERAIEATVIAQAHARIAEVISMARAADTKPAPPTVVALERLLRRVESRRQQVMAESVA